MQSEHFLFDCHEYQICMSNRSLAVLFCSVVICKLLILYGENQLKYTTVTPTISRFYMCLQVFIIIGPIIKRKNFGSSVPLRNVHTVTWFYLRKEPQA